MKTSTTHLPQDKITELQNIVLAIQKNCNDVQKIILFGSYARGNYKEAKDLKPESKSGHISDYDILVVTEKKEIALDATLWAKVSEILQNLSLSASPKLIAHDIAELNKKLSEGQYFFSDIKKEGILLFDTKKYELAEERKLSPQEKQKVAKNHFEHWFNKAEDFLDSFQLMMLKGRFTSSAFHLHQIAESCYKAILLVFTNYTPREHFLEILDKEAGKHHAKLKNIFPKLTKEDEDRFKLLEYAYIGGRYDPEYHISREDLEILAVNVKKLVNLTEEICKKKIEEIAS
jgi:HEPN domain-containing protein/predicted nucleotidyltransferase